jgi:hypothetical protein
VTLHDLQVQVEPWTCWTCRDCSPSNVRTASTIFWEDPVDTILLPGRDVQDRSRSYLRQRPTQPASRFRSGCRQLRRIELLQLRILRLGFLQDWDVGVGVFPEREKVFVGSERPDAGGIRIRPSRCSRLQRVRTCHAQTRQRSGPAVPDDAVVIENLLELGGGGTGLSGCEIRLSTNVGGPPRSAPTLYPASAAANPIASPKRADSAGPGLSPTPFR